MSIDTPPGQFAQRPAGPSRRTLARGVAWATPAVLMANAAPAVAASIGQCVNPTMTWASGWSTTLGGAFTSGTCGGTQPGSDGKWWRWCDSTTTSSHTYTRTRSFSVVEGLCYTVSFTTQANPGFPAPSSGAYLTASIGGTQYWEGHTRSTYQSPVTTNRNQLIINPAYTDQTWSFVYAATTTGTVAFAFKWQIQSRSGGFASSDDIGTTAPTITCALCP